MSKLGTALAFLAGAALGGVSAWYVAKTRYDELSEQEIDSCQAGLLCQGAAAEGGDLPL